MICPYTVDTVDITQWRYEYNDDGTTSFAEQVQKLQRKEHICLKNKCAAWQNDCCKYNGER